MYKMDSCSGDSFGRRDSICGQNARGGQNARLNEEDTIDEAVFDKYPDFEDDGILNDMEWVALVGEDWADLLRAKFRRDIRLASFIGELDSASNGWNEALNLVSKTMNPQEAEQIFENLLVGAYVKVTRMAVEKEFIKEEIPVMSELLSDKVGKEVKKIMATCDEIDMVSVVHNVETFILRSLHGPFLIEFGVTGGIIDDSKQVFQCSDGEITVAVTDRGTFAVVMSEKASEMVFQEETFQECSG